MIPVRAHDGLLGWPGIGPTSLDDWGGELYTSNGIFAPDRTGWYFVSAAGGGGGYGSLAFEAGGPAACVIHLPVFFFDGMVLPIKIGAGGLGGGDGADGGDTSIGDWLVLGGGGGGAGSNAGSFGQISGRYFDQFNTKPDVRLVHNQVDYYGIKFLHSVAGKSDADIFKFSPVVHSDPGVGYGNRGVTTTSAGMPGMVLIGWIGT